MIFILFWMFAIWCFFTAEIHNFQKVFLVCHPQLRRLLWVIRFPFRQPQASFLPHKASLFKISFWKASFFNFSKLIFSLSMHWCKFHLAIRLVCFVTLPSSFSSAGHVKKLFNCGNFIIICFTNGLISFGLKTILCRLKTSLSQKVLLPL